MVLNGGALDDVRILGAGTVAHMSRDHFGPISRDGEVARWLLVPGYGVGLGVAVRLAEGEHPMPGSVGDYYRGGAFGTLFLIDPKRNLIAVAMINQASFMERHMRLFRTLVCQTLAE